MLDRSGSPAPALLTISRTDAVGNRVVVETVTAADERVQPVGAVLLFAFDSAVDDEPATAYSLEVHSGSISDASGNQFTGIAAGAWVVYSGPRPCLAASECSSNVCGASGFCAEASCSDGVKNADETDVDCGGSCPALCTSGTGCSAGSDCTSGVCSGSVCRDPTCSDGVRNADETDIDCGGSCSAACSAGSSCGTGGDCGSRVCAASVCQAPTCSDGVRNGDEGGPDCGGSCPVLCAHGVSCAADADCRSSVCHSGSGQCSAPTCSDGVANGDETGVDCGGPCATKCANNVPCRNGGDCVSGVCSGTEPLRKCAAPSCSDGVANGDERGVDCGGSCGAGCPTGAGCQAGGDCLSGVCDSDTSKCAAPSCSDGVRNGNEVGVDCGAGCRLFCPGTGPELRALGRTGGPAGASETFTGVRFQSRSGLFFRAVYRPAGTDGSADQTGDCVITSDSAVTCWVPASLPKGALRASLQWDWQASGIFLPVPRQGVAAGGDHSLPYTIT